MKSQRDPFRPSYVTISFTRRFVRTKLRVRKYSASPARHDTRTSRLPIMFHFLGEYFQVAPRNPFEVSLKGETTFTFIFFQKTIQNIAAYT